MQTIYIVFEGNGSYSDRSETPMQAFHSESEAESFRTKQETDRLSDQENAKLIDAEIEIWQLSNPGPSVSFTQVPEKPKGMQKSVWVMTREYQAWRRECDAVNKRYHDWQQDKRVTRKAIMLKLGLDPTRDYSCYPDYDYFIRECPLV